MKTQNSDTWAITQAQEFGVNAKPVVFSVRGPVVNRNRTGAATSNRVTGSLSVTEMVVGGQKNQFALTRPTFGVKGYNVQQTSMFEPYYKI